MAVVPQEAISQFEALIEEVDESLKRTLKNVHQGCPHETLMRFLKAREGNVTKAHKMKPIIPVELYRAIRDSQLIGLSGYSNEGLPVFAVGVGSSTFDRASVHYYVQSHIQINEYRDRVILPAATKKHGKHISKCIKVLDMNGLKLSALNQIKLMTIISSIDDLNYPEKTVTYYIVNAPYVFSACWKIMDYSSLPHFCRKRSSGSSKHFDDQAENCFSLDHPFHQQLYNYIKQQSSDRERVQPLTQGSVHVTLPEDADEAEIAKILESELEKFEDLEKCPESLNNLKINDNKC
ncbi:phosphatidylinositol/phosphatidylcholine transfer protein sfh2 [Phtheirospermum japonicum]|uniref:Phosphatidylinositol/phosphatidylcholine transfer protein sfh2 n=1 Tax=Phtheirospermum japonicum TaxID=374723 RepID=A0A830BZ30_9LAMI|nr:phosphatidylinositol/phosphatidylcholine transfer protein sfh2 [Phtheirospermum japonicum]